MFAETLPLKAEAIGGNSTFIFTPSLILSPGITCFTKQGVSEPTFVVRELVKSCENALRFWTLRGIFELNKLLIFYKDLEMRYNVMQRISG